MLMVVGLPKCVPVTVESPQPIPRLALSSPTAPARRRKVDMLIRLYISTAFALEARREVCRILRRRSHARTPGLRRRLRADGMDSEGRHDLPEMSRCCLRRSRRRLHPIAPPITAKFKTSVFAHRATPRSFARARRLPAGRETTRGGWGGKRVRFSTRHAVRRAALDIFVYLRCC